MIRPGRQRIGVGVLIATAATAGVMIARRRLLQAEPAANLSGSPVLLDSPMRPPLGEASEARILPPRWEPPALTALASWEPSAPQRPLTRAAAYAWAAPLTGVGLLVGALTGVRPQLREGVVLFADARGPAGAVLRGRRYAAGAIGHVVIAVDDPSSALLAHELVHVRHAERLGIFSAVLYAILLGMYGYARHPMERAARKAARRTAGAP